MLSQASLRRRHIRWRDHVTGLLFGAPFIIGFLAFTLYPFFASLYYSFTEYGLLKQPEWVGLQNYADLMKDTVFHTALSNNAYLIFVGMPAYIIWSLIVAFLLNVNVRGLPLYRTIYLLPAIMPSVAASFVWLWVLNPRTGIGYYLSLLGITPPLWYNDPQWAKPGLILFWFWAVGLDALILLAALQGIPQDLKEAAELDGATPLRRAWSLDLPLISPAILFVTVTGVIWTVSYFTQAFIIAGPTGGRESSMLFLALYLYVNAFQYLKMGYAAALAWVLFILNAIMTFLMLQLTRERVFYG